MADAEVAERLISDIGKQLAARKTCPNKDLLVKLLRQAESAFPELDQSSSLEPSIKPLINSLVKHNLLQHKDKDIRLLVALCFCEIIRVLAPSPDLTDVVFKDIFTLFLGLFADLADTTSPYFPRRLKVLETLGKLNFFVLMFDTGCDDLVPKMFDIFFSVVREHHPQSLFSAMSSIIGHILKEKEKVTHSLIDIILQNLLKEEKGASPVARMLAVSVIRNCAEELETYVFEFLTSCIVNRDGVRSDLKEFYHEIIYEVIQHAPQMLLNVIPTLTQELLADQVDVRIKAVKFIGRLLALPGRHLAHEYHQLFLEFTKRFSDKSAEVRLGAISCAKAFYMTYSSGTEALEVLTALEGRLLDFDDRVRTQAVVVVCDLARANLKSVPHELISRATERLRDKKVSVRKKALQKLLEVYRDYCTKCATGIVTPIDQFEQIPCKILMLCYDKDCKEFSLQSMELVLAEELFPASLAIEERTRHWIFLFSLFDSPHLKALNAILSHKRRLQAEMQVYLTLLKEENNGSEEVQKGIQTSLAKLASYFPESSKAEECFHKLNLEKDDKIFTTLAQLLDEVNLKSAESTRVNFLRKMGDRHPHFGFLQLLSRKCLFSIFSSEHVQCILDQLLSDKLGNKNLENSTVKLLLGIISAFPSLLRGSENLFQSLLLKDGVQIHEELILILAKAGPHIHIKISDIYPSLERVCLEGTRAQSKLAVSAIAALTNASELFIFSELCETLVNALHGGQNIPTLLQSWGCLAQHAVSGFDSRHEEISRFIIENLLQSTNVEKSDCIDSSDEKSGYSVSCKLKIFGLKALVRSFLPHRSTHVGHDINQLIDVLSKLLQNGHVSDGIMSCESDMAYMRLAAAKSVLRLSRRWDLHIPPQIFRVTILMAKDSTALVCKPFTAKIHKLLKQHAIPSKYACAFAIAASDSLENVRDESLKCMGEFVKEFRRKARTHQTSAKQQGFTDYPEYIVVFLIHVLAHDSGFPPENCDDEEIYALFLRPFAFTLHALVNASFVDGDMDVIHSAVSCLQKILFAIKQAEDAVDAHTTPRLVMLADFGISLLNALNYNANSETHTPGLILLPSSLYRICPAEKRQEASFNCLARSHLIAKIAKRVALCFESQISHPSSARNKRGRKCQEDFSKLEIIKCSTLNLPLHKTNDLFTYRTGQLSDASFSHGKEMHETLNQELNIRGRQKRALSPTPRRSVELHNEFAIYDENEKSESGNSEPLIRREHLPSSCDSVTTEPSLTHMEDLKSSSVIVNGVVGLCDRTGAELSKCTGMANLCSLKDFGNTSQELIGQRIKLWSSVDRCYYSGRVSGFDHTNVTHKITYDNGQVEVVCLETENWETISNDFLQEKESNTSNSQHCDFVNHQTKLDDEFRDDICPAKSFPIKSNKNFLKRKIPLPGKENKGQKLLMGTSRSEVIDENPERARRTRRRQ
ncbi:sister chromatid cohesion protein PDS5 homolog B isoform X2 [Rhododendron vialii]|uniref:sister chromatid cohesion protein PDS5 homolog B isoform X2 n=1 Tax=Rhododendron vialii TaxID=182163 RepID=UPI00265FAADD|nr:sister chromatid cohesion protein PDS5 homolog B isoform X2 [Rhododendron vialii]